MEKDSSGSSRPPHWVCRYDIDKLARESGWSSRNSGKIRAWEFCDAMIQAASIPKASLRLVAFLSGMAARTSVSGQAIHKRVNPSACKMFEAVLLKVMRSKLPSSRLRSKLPFKRIIVQDSTSIALPSHLFEEFPGARNGHGQYAGAKVHASFDLLARRFVAFSICEHRKADQGFSPQGVEGFGKGDLLMRDLGYFNIEAFESLKESSGEILTRWQPRTTLWDKDSSERIELGKLLGKARGAVDMEVSVGAKHRFSMRLLALPLPSDIAEQRRRAALEEAKRRKRTPSKELLELQDWQIYLTTCSSSQLSLEHVYELYRQRWAIEILFKAFKSHMHIDKLPPRASSSMTRCLVLCSLVAIARSVVAVLPVVGKKADRPEISLLKFYSLIEAMGGQPSEEMLRDPALQENLLRHCRYEKGKRTPTPRRLQSLG